MIEISPFRSTHRSICPVLFWVGVAACGGTESHAETFVENFSTLDYRDPVTTTACWDTAAGQLHLHPYPLGVEAGVNVIKTARCFARSGDHVFLGITDTGIHVLDISDIYKMEYVGEYFGVEFPSAMWVEGDFLYLAAFNRFIIFDISDPTNPQILGETPEVTQVNDVVVSGDLAVLSSCNSGVHCIDITDPTAPVVIGQVDTPSCAQSLTLHGDHAYVCTGYLGFAVIDISDPSSPRHVAQVPASHHPERICVSGNLAYVAEGSGELLIYSLVDPAAPAPLGACRLPGHGLDVVVTGPFAYVCIGDPDAAGICAVDVHDPTAPRVLSCSELVGFPVGIELFGEFALVNSLTHFLAVRMADPQPPMALGELEEPLVFDFRIDGCLAYLLAWDIDGRLFSTVSVADPASPVVLGECRPGPYPLDLALKPPHAYLSCFDAGLAVVDIRDPEDPHVVRIIELDRTGVSVLPHGDHLFLGYIDNGVGLMTLDIHDPTNPVPLNELPLEYSPREMCLSGHHLFVLQWEDGASRSRTDQDPGRRQSDVVVLDIGDPAAPVPVAAFTIPEAYVEFLRVDGDLLYASFWTYESLYGNGFAIYDITDPRDPRSVGRWDDGGGLGQLVLAGDLAYQTGGNQIDVLDVSDPTSPRHLHSLHTARETIWLRGAGDCIFATGGYGGLRTIRVFDRSVDVFRNVAQSVVLPALDTPLTFVRMDAVQTPTVSWEFSADGGDHWQVLPPPGLWLELDPPGDEPCWRATLDYTEIGEPPVVDKLRLEWISDPMVGVGGAAPGGVWVQGPAPNPFNPRTTLRFRLPREGRVRVEIFDLAGRVVRRLVDARLPTGEHRLDWDGRNDAGAALASGTYAYRLQVAGVERSGKLVLIR